jgi:small subunit ribosomal protein S13
MFLFRDFVLSEKKEIKFTLKQIYGIGLNKSIKIINILGLSSPYYTVNLNQYQINIIIFLLKGLVISESKIKKIIENNINKLYNNGSLRGVRHKLSLPVRGQRTRTNAQTQRNKRIII